jgi:hypothetical protein
MSGRRGRGTADVVTTDVAGTAATTAEVAKVDVVAAFRLRCEAQAKLFAEGHLTLHEAVDDLQWSAVSSGLVGAIGQDAVQAIISDAFSKVRQVPEAAWPDYLLGGAK